MNQNCRYFRLIHNLYFIKIKEVLVLFDQILSVCLLIDNVHSSIIICTLAFFFCVEFHVFWMWHSNHSFTRIRIHMHILWFAVGLKLAQTNQQTKITNNWVLTNQNKKKYVKYASFRWSWFPCFRTVYPPFNSLQI